MTPKVTVIILTCNRATLLPAAIASVLNQTFTDFELIVVDDASTDNTREVVSRLDDQRIRYVAHDTNKGEAESRNTGVKNSRGEYIAFLDDDDEWLPHKLRLQVNLLDSCPAIVGGVYTSLIYVDRATGKVTGQRLCEKRGYVYPAMAEENVLGPLSGVLLRRRCFEIVGLFDGNIGYGPDYEISIRLSKRFEFECIQEPLVKYYLHGGQISLNHAFMAKGLEAIMQKHDRLFALNKQRYSERYLEVSRLYWMVGMRGKAWRARWKALQIWPFGRKNYESLLQLLTAVFLAWVRSCRIGERWRGLCASGRHCVGR